MTKWANPTSRRRVHPAWYAILAGIGIVVLLVLTCEGCAATGNKGVDTSRTATTTVKAPEVHGDNARVTTISLTSVGGYGWGGMATLVGLVVWRQKRTRETAARRMIWAISNAQLTNGAVSDVVDLVERRGKMESGNGQPDAAEVWINKQVKRP